MPDESKSADLAQWTRVADLDRLQRSRPIAVKVAGKQIALFLHEGEIYASNNRCPHEGYPLIEGELSAGCVLTCRWHNWKFDLRSGATIYGGDNLRVYPVKVEDGAIWVDIRDPPAAWRIERAIAHLDEAMADYDTARIARELARLVKAGAKPEVALSRAIAATYDRLRDGMTHAYAAAEAWLRLADRLTEDAQHLTCAAEAIAYIAYDTLRERAYPFTSECAPWNAREFPAAVEAQDEARAAAMINGALAQGLGFADIEGALADAALAHYNDFGHTLIYLGHVRRLIGRLGDAVEKPLLLAWLRSLIYATREDLLPDFRGYADALAAWPAVASRGAAPPSAAALEGLSIRKTLDATLAAAGADPFDLYYALVEAAAIHLLRFDERHALRADVSVADNVGWLDFSHALTFGHALREQCARQPRLWSQGLLQLALFVGRNSGYLNKDVTGAAALRRWGVSDEIAFDAAAMAKIVDHGLGLPIFPAHWLKTWTAVRDESEAGVPAATRAAMLAAANRLLAVRFKERHALRTAHQAFEFVARED